MPTRKPDRYAISVVRGMVDGVDSMRATATGVRDAVAGEHSASASVSSLVDGTGVRAFVQWAERLPWADESGRSDSYHESIFVERMGPGYEPGYRVDAYNDFTEEFSDGETIWDRELRDPEAWRALLQWAESLGTLT